MKLWTVSSSLLGPVRRRTGECKSRRKGCARARDARCIGFHGHCVTERFHGHTCLSNERHERTMSPMPRSGSLEGAAPGQVQGAQGPRKRGCRCSRPCPGTRDWGAWCETRSKAECPRPCESSRAVPWLRESAVGAALRLPVGTVASSSAGSRCCPPPPLPPPVPGSRTPPPHLSLFACRSRTPPRSSSGHLSPFLVEFEVDRGFPRRTNTAMEASACGGGGSRTCGRGRAEGTGAF